MSKILIVEDNPEQLNLLERNIRGEGREVEACRNSREAEDLINQHRFDLIVSDLRMVGQNPQDSEKDAGISVLRLAKCKDEDIQVIIVTNYATPEVSKAAMKNGAFEFLDRNPSGIDFWAMLRAKVSLALQHRALLLRNSASGPMDQ